MSAEDNDKKIEKPKTKSVNKKVATKNNVHKSGSRRELAPAHVFVEMDDEVTFLIEKITDQKSRRIFISAAENAQLLTSKVSMKLLQEKLDKMGKVMIVVTKDSLAAKTSLDVGIMAVPNPDGVNEEDWDTLEEDSQERLRKSLSKIDAPDRSQIDQNLAKIKAAAEKEKQLEQEREARNSQMMQGKEVDIDGFTMVVGGDILDHKKSHSDEDIDDTMESDISDNEDPEMQESHITPTKNLAGAGLARANLARGGLRRNPEGAMPMPAEGVNASSTKKININFEGLKERFLKPQILLPVVVGFVGIIALLYIFLPRVIINATVESVSVDSEFDAEANTSTTKVDIAALKVPALLETVEESGSDTATATGKGERGDKATGQIFIINNATENKTVPKGTTVTRNGGKQYTTNDAVTVPNTGSSATVGITAAEVGSDYNYEGSAGSTTFTISGFSELTGKNSGVISGGSKEEYTAVTQKNLDDLTNKLRDQLFADGEAKIKEKHGNDKWVLVEGSIKSALDGDPSPDAKAGDEKTDFNVAIETKTTALFYDRSALDKIVEDKLKKEASKSEENTEADDFKVSDDTSLDIKVGTVKDGSATMTVTASGLLTPQIKASDIADAVKGQNWVRGNSILKNMKYVEEGAEAIFLPNWFPQFLYRFPADTNRIEVNIRYTGAGEEN